MHKHFITIPDLFSLLKNHIEKVTEFNNQLDICLSNSVASDLYFEGLTDSFIRHELGLPEYLTRSQKIITIIKEISNCSKLYLEKMLPLFQILEVLIRFSVNS